MSLPFAYCKRSKPGKAWEQGVHMYVTCAFSQTDVIHARTSVHQFQ